MNTGLDLEKRYRRVLRLLPGWYRDRWEQDMVSAFLDSWLTGDPEDDDAILEFCKPTWQEVASVVGLAARLYLGGAGTPRRYFAWGQAVRYTVLVVMLVHAMRGIGGLLLLAASHHLIGWPPPPPATSGIWSMVSYAVNYAWIVIFVALVLGDFRAARVLAVVAIVPDLVALVQTQLAGTLLSPFGSWAFWVLLDLAPVLAMAAFHRDAPLVSRRPWLLALPAGYLLVFVPLLAAGLTGHAAWVPDFPGLCCILVSLICLAHLPRARSGLAGSGVWSLTLVLLAAVAGVFRIVSLGDYLHGNPHMIHVGLAELVILVAAAALVAADAARALRPMPAPPAYPHLG
jgi:hypothetical protein